MRTGELVAVEWTTRSIKLGIPKNTLGEIKSFFDWFADNYSKFPIIEYDIGFGDVKFRLTTNSNVSSVRWLQARLKGRYVVCKTDRYWRAFLIDYDLPKKFKTGNASFFPETFEWVWIVEIGGGLSL